ncbi:hypothetical protein B0H16DRAFT_1623540 [Mycena metata]|uniref:Uncharacterized protein n=1 Tax=Mycena metata TaxID=1033252 RepID=A0AAD7H5Z2_9AGAR|nr:hypothetical protein B0H16DRAFT_1623540 [Mycena metata]
MFFGGTELPFRRQPKSNLFSSPGFNCKSLASHLNFCYHLKISTASPSNIYPIYSHFPLTEFFNWSPDALALMPYAHSSLKRNPKEFWSMYIVFRKKKVETWGVYESYTVRYRQGERGIVSWRREDRVRWIAHKNEAAETSARCAPVAAVRGHLTRTMSDRRRVWVADTKGKEEMRGRGSKIAEPVRILSPRKTRLAHPHAGRGSCVPGGTRRAR